MCSGAAVAEFCSPRPGGVECYGGISDKTAEGSELVMSSRGGGREQYSQQERDKILENLRKWMSWICASVHKEKLCFC